VSYLAIIVGLIVVVGSIFAWRSEAFFEYFSRQVTRQPTRYPATLTKTRAQIGLRGALVLAALAGLIVVAAGVYDLL
jgi:hypothetical protein